MNSLQEKLNVNITSDEILNEIKIKYLERYIIKYISLLLISSIFNPLLFFLSNFYFLRNLPSNIQNPLFILNVIALLIYIFFCAHCAIKYHNLSNCLKNPKLLLSVSIYFFLIQALLSSIMDKYEMKNETLFTLILFIINFFCIVYYVDLDLTFDYYVNVEKLKRQPFCDIELLCSQ